MNRLFEEFSMVGDLSINPNGSGFGLHISNRILEAMQGTALRVTSILGQGTTFNFDIPITDVRMNDGSDFEEIECSDSELEELQEIPIERRRVIL